MSELVLFEQSYRGNRWRLEVATHRKRTFVNWRKWYAKDESWKPTREGCTIPLERLGELTAALMRYHGLEPPIELENGS